MILGREPAIILGAIQAAIALAIGLNLITLTVDQVALVMGFSAAIAALIVRQVVTPTAAPTLPAGTTVKVAGTDSTSTV